MRATVFRVLLVAFLALLTGCSPATRIDTVTVEEQLTNLLELHTYEHIYRDVVYFGEEKSFLFFRTVDRRVLFSIDIRVRAGVDLRQGVSVIPDASDPNRIYVQLPPAEILSVDADEASIHEYFIREQGGRIGLLEMTGQLSEVKQRVAADAIDRGILERAGANAQQIVGDFLTLAGFTDVLFAPPPPAREGLQG